MSSDETPTWQRLQEPDKIKTVHAIAEAMHRGAGGERAVKRAALDRAAGKLDLQAGTGYLGDLWDAAFEAGRRAALADIIAGVLLGDGPEHD